MDNGGGGLVGEIREITTLTTRMNLKRVTNMMTQVEFL